MSSPAVLARVGPRNRRGIVRSGDLGRRAAPGSPVIGDWLLVIHWSLVIGHWSLAANVVRLNLSMAVHPREHDTILRQEPTFPLPLPGPAQPPGSPANLR